MCVEQGHIKENYDAFRKDLEVLINKHSMENVCDTPDFILAEYLTSCLYSYGKTVNNRTHWVTQDSQGC